LRECNAGSARAPNTDSGVKSSHARDSNRATAPLKPAADARTLDSSGLSVDQAVEQIIGWFSEVRV